ncbi:MAG TPA: NADPH-dependent 2,4-dienoyl-CoA reductase, partial [Candidatus Cybelea sp.]|nr:NADPH-dependent 2,4-dienoyl-CoA reductase [Candidatus Cybelea sp.]
MFEHALAAGSIGSLRLRNRIVMGSMHLGIESDGAALAAFYAERARGGAGLIVTGGSSVSRVGAGGRNYSFINDPQGAPPLRQAAAAVHEAGGQIALQLFHAGRYALYASFGLRPVAPSAIPSRFSPDPPHALTGDEIRETIGDFARGAVRARELGFDAVEVMASEGYLLNQFLSPLTNRRDDDWGGDVERRMRLPREVLREIRACAGADFPVIFRISGADLMPGSTNPAE